MYAYVVCNPWTKYDPEGLFWAEAGQYLGGSLQGWAESNGATEGNRPAKPSSYYKAGLATGHAGGLAQSVVETNIGGGMMASGAVIAGGGTLATATGVAAPAGVPTVAVGVTDMAVGAAVAVHGTAVGVNSLNKLAEDLSSNKSDGGSPSGSAKETQSPQDRGRESEGRVLDDKGQVKNTEKVSGSEGNSIPDYTNDKAIGEIKDTKKVTDSKQLRIQREAAAAQGKQHEVVTGTKTQVSKTVETKSTVERRPDLGPK